MPAALNAAAGFDSSSRKARRPDAAPGPARGTALTIRVTLAQVGGLLAFMRVVGRRLFPWAPWHVARTGSRELFTLCVVAAAVSIAHGLAGTSPSRWRRPASRSGSSNRTASSSSRCNAGEAGLLERDGTGTVFLGEGELAAAMARHVVALVAAPNAGSAH